jgi:uncharacterized protein YbjT (DUF2867 family)
MAKTLIVGATGHLGQEMVKACKKQGNEVHALVRPATRGDATKMKDYGLDPAAAGPRSCVLFDGKSAIHKSIKESAIPYTFVHANGFFSYWVFTLGDLTKLGSGKLPTAEVNVYGEGNIKGSFVSLPDIAAVTVRALNDSKMQNKEVRIIANAMTQNELIDLWQKKSGQSVKKVTVSAADMEKTIATSTLPEQGMMLVLTQLHRSMWIRGDGVKRPGSALDATDLYPDIKLQTVEQGLAQLL